MAMAGELVSSRVSPERVNRSQGWNRSQNWLPAIFHQQINPETNALTPHSSYQRNRDDGLPLRGTSNKAAQTCGCSAAGPSKDTQILTLLSIKSKVSKSLPKRWAIQVLRATPSVLQKPKQPLDGHREQRFSISC